MTEGVKAAMVAGIFSVIAALIAYCGSKQTSNTTPKASDPSSAPVPGSAPASSSAPPSSPPPVPPVNAAAVKLCKVVFYNDINNGRNIVRVMENDLNTKRCIDYAATFGLDATHVQLGCRQSGLDDDWGRKFAIRSNLGYPEIASPFAPDPNCGWKDWRVFN